MSRIFILASAALAALSAPAAAAPETVRLAPDSIAIRMPFKALKSPSGRAELLGSLQASARRLCADVQPRADAPACELGVVASAQLKSIPPVAEAIRLARQEQQQIFYAAAR